MNVDGETGKYGLRMCGFPVFDVWNVKMWTQGISEGREVLRSWSEKCGDTQGDLITNWKYKYRYMCIWLVHAKIYQHITRTILS